MLLYVLREIPHTTLETETLWKYYILVLDLSISIIADSNEVSSFLVFKNGQMMISLYLIKMALAFQATNVFSPLAYAFFLMFPKVAKNCIKFVVSDSYKLSMKSISVFTSSDMHSSKNLFRSWDYFIWGTACSYFFSSLTSLLFGFTSFQFY